ncbi:MAG: class I SAM-dependent methyltransferase [Pseudomonadota bacterium]
MGHGAIASLSASQFWALAHQQSNQASRQTDDKTEEAFWRDYAPDYDQKSPLAACATELIEHVCALIDPAWHMLEIGAGPGAFTRRLAPKLANITIVEPSAAMRAEFERLWDGHNRIETLACKWEEVEDAEADFVFGANAFYRMPDIATALLKMNAVARHRVALVQTIGRPHANPLTVQIDGQTFERERADVLCGVLRQLDIKHSRRDFKIIRPDGASFAAFIDWVPE